jgi:hypothetical protein
MNTENAENDPLFNFNVDLPTTLPLHCLPLRHPEEKKLIIGVIQIINRKGIMGRAVANHVTMDMTSTEILQAFTVQVLTWLVASDH